MAVLIFGSAWGNDWGTQWFYQLVQLDHAHPLSHGPKPPKLLPDTLWVFPSHSITLLSCSCNEWGHDNVWQWHTPHSARVSFEAWAQAAAISDKSIKPRAVLDKELKGNWRQFIVQEKTKEKREGDFSQQILLFPFHYLLFFLTSCHKLLIHPHSCVSLEYSLWDLWICFEF